MNPLEALALKLKAIYVPPEDKVETEYETGYRHGTIDAYNKLTAVIAPYKRVPGPPTEPGWCWYKTRHSDTWLTYKVTPTSLKYKELDFDNGVTLFQEIEWHAKVMPPFGGEEE